MTKEAGSTAHMNPLLTYGELVRQSFLPAVSSSFAATPNQRNKRMLKECNRHARLSKHFVKKVKAIAKATDELLAEAELVIASPLPTQFTMRGGVLQQMREGLELVEGSISSATGTASTAADSPTPSTGKAVKKAAKAEFMAAKDNLGIGPIRTAFRQELEAKVYKPINDWLEKLAQLKKDHKAAEMVRFELDAARRRLSSMDAKKMKMERDGKTDEGYTTLTTKITNLSAQADSFAAAYETQEASVNSTLKDLIAAAEVLKGSVTDAFDICSDTLAKISAPGGFVEKSFVEASKFDPEDEGEDKAKYTLEEDA